MGQAVLSIETSSNSPAVAFRDSTGATRSQQLPAGRGCAAQLVLTLRTWRDEGIEPDVILVGCGPGSYSGVRGGITAAVGFALATGADVAGMISHFSLDVAEDRFVAFGDAGRGRWYRATIDRSNVAFEWQLIEPGGGLEAALDEQIPQFDLAPLAGSTRRIAMPSATRALELYGLRGRSITCELRPVYLQSAVAAPSK